jgi:hypothetical protein
VFHSPPVLGVQVHYAPFVISTRFIESFWMLPQVYFSIFVPPQNRFLDTLSYVIEKKYSLKSMVVL